MPVKTKGTQLFIIDPTQSDGPEVLAIACATSLSGLGGAREQIDVTCLEDDSREYVGGLSTPGTLTVQVNFDPENESHFRLYELWKSNQNFQAAIGFGPSTALPTLDTDGEWELPATRTFVTFEGYVADLPLDASLNSVWSAAIPIQVTGDYDIIRKTA